MGLKVALQMDPIGSVNIDADSTFRIALEAQARARAAGVVALCVGAIGEAVDDHPRLHDVGLIDAGRVRRARPTTRGDHHEVGARREDVLDGGRQRDRQRAQLQVLQSPRDLLGPFRFRLLHHRVPKRSHCS